LLAEICTQQLFEHLGALRFWFIITAMATGQVYSNCDGKIYRYRPQN